MDNGRLKIIVAILTFLTTVGGSFITIYSKIESSIVRLERVEKDITEIKQDIKVIMGRL